MFRIRSQHFLSSENNGRRMQAQGMRDWTLTWTKTYVNSMQFPLMRFTNFITSVPTNFKSKLLSAKQKFSQRSTTTSLILMMCGYRDEFLQIMGNWCYLNISKRGFCRKKFQGRRNKLQASRRNTLQLPRGINKALIRVGTIWMREIQVWLISRLLRKRHVNSIIFRLLIWRPSSIRDAVVYKNKQNFEAKKIWK